MTRLNRCGGKGLPWLRRLCLALVSLAWVPGIGSANDARPAADLGGMSSWQVEVLADGTLLHLGAGESPSATLAGGVIDLPQVKVAANSALLKDDGSHLDPLSCGFVPQIVSDGAVQLPVDDWHEAQAIATAWLDAVGDPDLRLSKMRQLGGTYVLAIVHRSDDSKPRHQIVIGAHDGRVAVL